MKKYNRLKILLLLTITIMFVSCTNNKMVFKCKVYDAYSSKGLDKVQISIGDIKIKSGVNGEFSLPNLKANKEYIINIEHSDYVSITRKIKFAVPKSLNLNFTLIPRSAEKQFNSEDSIIFPFSNGGIIYIRPNSFATKSAGFFKGKINLRVTFINPKDNNTIAASPGIFISSDNKPLQTYGMVEIYATNPKGERLELIEKSPVSLVIPNIIGITANVGLYSLNITSGLWDRKGELIFDKKTNTLLGQVTSISTAWNADAPCTQTPVCVQFQFVDALGNPKIQFAAVKGVSYQGFNGWYQTDMNGYVNFLVCPNQVFKVVTGLVPCCNAGSIPGTPEHDFCCVNGGMTYGPTIDMSTVTLNPSSCTFIGQVVL
jgi:hypothetical protein